MTIFVVGINHKTAAIDLRENVYFSNDRLSLYLQDIISGGHAHEAVLLSTCNRSEIYGAADDVSTIRDWFCAQAKVPKSELEGALYIYQDEEAIRHMMHVACGLDSMILGEPQILGQMKEAFSESCTAGSVGALFQRLFQQIFNVAKDIRTTTAIGACPVSVASAAVRFAKQSLPDFNQSNAVLIGAGDTTELLMRYLVTHLERPMTLVNRSLDKASDLIGEFGGHAYGLHELDVALTDADVVFSATSSAVPVVNKALMTAVMQARRGKPIMLLDIAVPRDIEPAVAEIPGVNLYCVDDLKNIIEKNRQGREHAADQAIQMINRKCVEFLAELQSLDRVTHTIRSYRSQIEALCRTELYKARQQLHLGEDPAKVLEAFAYAYTQKLMHAPSVQLRQAGAEGRFELLRFAKQLFSLPDPEIELS